MNLKRIIGTAAVCGFVAVGLGSVLPAGAQTSDAPEPPSETTQCRFGQWPAEVQGRPMQLAAGATAGLYLWHDDHGWHAFVTHEDHSPVDFRITVRSSADIYGVGVKLEGGDAVLDHTGNRAVTLSARNYGYIDGMNFRTACGPHLEVSGTIDGVNLDASQVFMGKNGVHPDHFPTVIRRS